MTAQNLVEALLEGRNVQRAGIVDGDRLVVERKITRELSMQPHLLLSVGERYCLTWLARRNRLSRRAKSQLAAKTPLKQMLFCLGVLLGHAVLNT